MNDMSPAGIGHNQAPDPIELVTAEYDATITEAQNWTDGEPVTTEAQMKAVDEIIGSFKSYRTALTKAAKERTDPLHKAWKAEVAAVKVYTDDADQIQAALVATVAPFKATLAAEKEAARQAEWAKAREAERAAEEAARNANAADLDAQREAVVAKAAALEANKRASAAQKDTVKGMRTVTHHEVCDMRALVNWIATNDKDAMADFARAYAAKHHSNMPDAIVRTWTTKEAF